MGDAALYVELGRRMDPSLNSRCLGLARRLRTVRGVIEAIGAYASVTVHYDPDLITIEALSQTIWRLLERRERAGSTGRLHRIPVVYDGPDLEEVAETLGLAPSEVVKLHAGRTYRVYMIGFLPGWAYLGELAPELRLPRRRVPRTRVPAGTVAFAGSQTGVYSLPSPGGWHLVGHTDVPMFLPDADPPVLFRNGDHVRFTPIDARGRLLWPDAPATDFVPEPPVELTVNQFDE